MNPHGKSVEPGSQTGSGSDRAVANLLRLLGLYTNADTCPDREKRVSAAVRGQLALICNASSVRPVIRESCLDLLDRWLLHPEQREQAGEPHGVSGANPALTTKPAPETWLRKTTVAIETRIILIYSHAIDRRAARVIALKEALGGLPDRI